MRTRCVISKEIPFNRDDIWMADQGLLVIAGASRVHSGQFFLSSARTRVQCKLINYDDQSNMGLWQEYDQDEGKKLLRHMIPAGKVKISHKSSDMISNYLWEIICMLIS